MKEENHLRITLEENKFPKVDDLIATFCKKHRIYDEYFGVITRSMDIVLNKIITQNVEYKDDIGIRYNYDGKSLSFEIEGKPSLNVMFDTNAHEKDLETLKLLISDIAFPDTNILKMIFRLNAIHQQEWVRRNDLINNYYYRIRKRV